jgi:hypothetical protein
LGGGRGDWFIVGGGGGTTDVWPLLCLDGGRPEAIHCTKNMIYVFLRGLVPSSYIHVSVSDLYIFPRSVCIFGCSKIGRQILGIYKLLTAT